MKINLDEIERILIVRLSALGDCVSAIPVFSALRQRFPHKHIAWAVQDNYAPLIRNLPGVDEIIVFPRQRWKNMKSIWGKTTEVLSLARRLRMRRFDLVVDIQSNTKSATLSFLTGAPYRIGHGPGEAKEISPWIINRPVTHPADMKHIIIRNLNLLTPLGIEISEPCFPLNPDPFAQRTILEWLRAHDITEKGYCLLFPFCGRQEKEWPQEHFTRLAKELSQSGYRVLFCWTPGKDEMLKQMIPANTENNVIIGPKTDIPELVELIRSAGICCGGDTGPIQIAGALNIPNIALFGPTYPERTGPWTTSGIVSLDSEPDIVSKTIKNAYSG